MAHVLFFRNNSGADLDYIEELLTDDRGQTTFQLQPPLEQRWDGLASASDMSAGPPPANKPDTIFRLGWASLCTWPRDGQVACRHQQVSCCLHCGPFVPVPYPTSEDCQAPASNKAPRKTCLPRSMWKASRCSGHQPSKASALLTFGQVWTWASRWGTSLQ